jgi:prolyl-tRNA editing enzyme YbaK/EbsC (Cys-tRNA(Pro) deacylase)
MENPEEEKLKKYIADSPLQAEHIRYKESLKSVQDLLETTGLNLEYITKTIIFIDKDGKTISAMVPGKFRVSASKLGKVLHMPPPAIATPEETFQRTGYPVGGMPCFGYETTLVIDPKVFEKEFVYTGGGSIYSVTKIATEELKKLNPIVMRISGNKSN